MSKIFWSFVLCCGVWLVGLGWFIAQVPLKPSTDATPTDAVVVLTGGAGRLEYGLQLLAEGKGRKLFISGAGSDTRTRDFLNRAPESLAPFIAEERITLGHNAENTIGNAAETLGWLNQEGFKSIRLVTSAYHMPRSIAEFQEAAPALRIVPAPVFTNEFTRGWWLYEEGRRLVFSEYHKYLASKFRHLVVFILRKTA